MDERQMGVAQKAKKPGNQKKKTSANPTIPSSPPPRKDLARVHKRSCSWLSRAAEQAASCSEATHCAMRCPWLWRPGHNAENAEPQRTAETKLLGIGGPNPLWR